MTSPGDDAAGWLVLGRPRVPIYAQLKIRNPYVNVKTAKAINYYNQEKIQM